MDFLDYIEKYIKYYLVFEILLLIVFSYTVMYYLDIWVMQYPDYQIVLRFMYYGTAILCVWRILMDMVALKLLYKFQEDD
jgi:hypothetical protein